MGDFNHRLIILNNTPTLGIKYRTTNILRSTHSLHTSTGSQPNIIYFKSQFCNTLQTLLCILCKYLFVYIVSSENLKRLTLGQRRGVLYVWNVWFVEWMTCCHYLVRCCILYVRDTALQWVPGEARSKIITSPPPNLDPNPCFAKRTPWG